MKEWPSQAKVANFKITIGVNQNIPRFLPIKDELPSLYEQPEPNECI